MSVKPHLGENDMEVIVVATGFSTDNYSQLLFQAPETDPSPVVEEKIEVAPFKREVSPIAPTSNVIGRPSRNFDEIEAYTSEVSAFLKSQLSNFLTKRAMEKAERERAKAEAETKNGTKAEPETSAPADEEKIVYEPDHLFVAHAEAVEIPVLLEGEEDKVVVIEVKAETVVETWEIVLDNIEGLEYMSSAIAIISGQAESHYLGRKEDSEGEVSIYFEMDKDEENGRIIGKFNTFGKHPGEQSVLSLDVNVTDVNGGEQHYHFDIDSEFMDNPGMDITIEEPVVIEEPKSEGGGFAPSVEDWEEVRTEINL